MDGYKVKTWLWHTLVEERKLPTHTGSSILIHRIIIGRYKPYGLYQREDKRMITSEGVEKHIECHGEESPALRLCSLRQAQGGWAKSNPQGGEIVEPPKAGRDNEAIFNLLICIEARLLRFARNDRDWGFSTDSTAGCRKEETRTWLKLGSGLFFACCHGFL